MLPVEVLSFMVVLLGCLVVSTGFIVYCQCIGCRRKMDVGPSCLSCVGTWNLDSFSLVSSVVCQLCVVFPSQGKHFYIVGWGPEHRRIF